MGIVQIQGHRDVGTKLAPRRWKLIYRDPPAFAVESIHQFGTNVIA